MQQQTTWAFPALTIPNGSGRNIYFYPELLQCTSALGRRWMAAGCLLSLSVSSLIRRSTGTYVHVSVCLSVLLQVCCFSSTQQHRNHPWQLWLSSAERHWAFIWARCYSCLLHRVDEWFLYVNIPTVLFRSTCQTTDKHVYSACCKMTRELGDSCVTPFRGDSKEDSRHVWQRVWCHLLWLPRLHVAHFNEKLAER